MFQQFLGLGPDSLRIYAVLEPEGRLDDPWRVRCLACAFSAMARNHQAAVKLANWHDQQHDVANERANTP